jgi:glycosyltransferase involved in cell wall biosynthesis
MIVKDEERFLEGCIESVKEIVDEIVIVDTGSKDRTKEIAKKFDANVFDFEWKEDFSAARNFSIDKATSNWVLVLDADELLDDKGKKEILKLVNNRQHCLKDVIGFKMDQRTYRPKDGVEPARTTDAKEISRVYDSFESSKTVRLFKNHPKIRYRNRVHELVEQPIRDAKGEIVDTGIVVHHFSMMRGKRQQEKARMYTDLIWKQLQQQPENPRYNHQAALAFIAAGRKDLAMKYLTRTLKFDPDYKGILADMAKLYLEAGQTEKAIRFFNFAIAKDKSDVSSMNNLAVIYMHMQKYPIAKQLLEKAMQKEPENKAVLDNYEALKKKMDDSK